MGRKEQLVDGNWQEAAHNNATKGYPWAVWGKRKDKDWPLALLGSFEHEWQANDYKANKLHALKPKGDWHIIVVKEFASQID